MQLLEDPGKKLKTMVQVVFILGIVIIAIGAVLCIAAVSQGYYGPTVVELLVIVTVAAIIFLLLWEEALFISAYADMSEQLKRQTEILEKIESRSQPLS